MCTALGVCYLASGRPLVYVPWPIEMCLCVCLCSWRLHAAQSAVWLLSMNAEEKRQGGTGLGGHKDIGAARPLGSACRMD